MASLQRRLDQNSSSDREQRFYSHSLHNLSIASGTVVELDKWTITSFEVEFRTKIGSGGLYVIFTTPISTTHSLLTLNSGEVFQGMWNMTPIALKVLKTGNGIIPRAPVRDIPRSVCVFYGLPKHEDYAPRDKGQGYSYWTDSPCLIFEYLDMVPTFASPYSS